MPEELHDALLTRFQRDPDCSIGRWYECNEL